MDELIAELGSGAGPCERVIDIFRSPVTGTGTADSIEARPIHDKTQRAIAELRSSWGPTADPHWVADLLPDRDDSKDASEFDGLFALFRRVGVWGYVRLRGLTKETRENVQLRLILGVLRAKTPDI
jgi:hypothetical protein